MVGLLGHPRLPLSRKALWLNREAGCERWGGHCFIVSIVVLLCLTTAFMQIWSTSDSFSVFGGSLGIHHSGKLSMLVAALQPVAEAASASLSKLVYELADCCRTIAMLCVDTVHCHVGHATKCLATADS